MKEFLKKIKLIQYLTTDIDIQKNEFVSKFKQQVDPGGTGLFSDTFDVFSSSKNEYKGQVRSDGFKIKRRRRFFDMNANLAIARGSYQQQEEKLLIQTEINGFHGMMVPFYIFVVVFYSLFLITFFIVDEVGGNAPGWIMLPFVFFHGALMLGIPYFVMRRSIKRMKHELEREFFYMTKK